MRRGFESVAREYGTHFECSVLTNLAIVGVDPQSRPGRSASPEN